MSKDNMNENKNPSSLPEGLSSIADDEAITEIDLGDFLVENSKSDSLFEGFRDDIEKTEKSLEADLQSLYDDIIGSGPETIVPKPMSMLTESEAEPKKVVLSDPEPLPEDENTSLEDLWMNPDDYFDADIPVVSLDEEDAVQETEIFNEPSPEEVGEIAVDDAKAGIFSMIDMLKKETDTETGFDDILSEIEANAEIAPVDTELSSAAQLVSNLPAEEDEPEEEEEELDLGDEELDLEDEALDWEEMLEEDAPAPEIAEELPEIPVMPEENEEASSDEEFLNLLIDDNVDISVSFDDEELIADDESSVSESDKDTTFIFDDEISEEEIPEAEEKKGFVITVPDDGNDYEKAAAVPEKLYEAAPMSTASLLDDPDLTEEIPEEDDEKGKKKEKKEKSPVGAGEIARRIVLSLSIITIVVSLGILVNTYFIEPYRFKSDNDKIASEMNANINTHSDATVNDAQNSTPDIDYPDGMLAKYASLYAANDDLRGWVSIPGFEINLPVAQGKDNNYYLKKDIYGKYTRYGVPFFDYRIDNFTTLHRNTVIYGHNMRHDDLIFGMLENYRDINGFRQAPVIECNTIYGDHTWFVYAVFISNSDKEDDNGYVFPYNFIDVGDAKFQQYIEEIDKRKLYTTGVDILPTDKILTLSTCCYDFEDARLVVVARLRRDGESVAVDTSRAYPNDNIKYPQKWYDVNNKTNNFESDPRW